MLHQLFDLIKILFCVAMFHAMALDGLFSSLGELVTTNAKITPKAFAVATVLAFFALIDVFLMTASGPQSRLDGARLVLTVLLFALYILSFRGFYVCFMSDLKNLEHTSARLWVDGDVRHKLVLLVSAKYGLVGRLCIALAALFPVFGRVAYECYLEGVKNNYSRAAIHHGVDSWFAPTLIVMTVVILALSVSSYFDVSGGIALRCLSGFDTTEVMNLHISRYRTHEHSRANVLAARVERAIPRAVRNLPTAHAAEATVAYRKLADCIRRHSFEEDDGVRSNLENLYWATVTLFANSNVPKAARTINRMLSGQPDAPQPEQSIIFRYIDTANSSLQSNLPVLKLFFGIIVAALLCYTVGFSGVVEFFKQVVLNK